MERIQSVVFMRHAIALHNVAMASSTAPKTPSGEEQNPSSSASVSSVPSIDHPSWLDPELTTLGKFHAIVAGQITRAHWSVSSKQRLNQHPFATVQSDHGTMPSDPQNPKPFLELIVSSPLTRCLQTATLAFLPSPPMPTTLIPTGANDGHDHHNAPAAHMVCREDVREAFGMHYPDQRRRKSVLQAHWPAVHFDDSMSENDVLWKANVRETCNDVANRVAQFLAWLVQQPQSNVVVVSHGVWLETLLRLYAPEYWNASNVLAATNGYPKRVYNTDAYQCEVVSRVNSSSRNDGAGGTFVRIQNVRQICEQHQVANACRMTALGQT